MTRAGIAAQQAKRENTLQLAVGQYSSKGLKPLNQDSMAARLPDGHEARLKGCVFAVADGISSSECSQIAAETAVKALVTDYYATPDAWTVKTSARRVIEATNSWLYAQNRQARTSDMNRGMVCTLSALIFKAREAHVFHIGDSRVSRFYNGILEPLTDDHVHFVSEHEQFLGRAIGAQNHVDIDYRRFPLQPGDVFLLSTDGVHEYIDGNAVAEALQAGSLDEAAQCIAEAALARGSNDNLTIQIARVEALADDDLPPEFAETLPLLAEVPGIGTSIDDFQILREIHKTTRSQLMLATAPDGRRVVLKFPGIETGEDPDYLQRFAYEEWIARRVDSPHVIRAAAVSAQRSACYVAMDWVEGSTLRQWMIDHENPSLDEVRSIAEQVARGLQALHRREMIHQDLRPENIMLDRNGTAVIIDLGSVAVAGLQEAAPGLFGIMPGTYQYTAPEYLSGDIVSWRSDQYALAVIVYEMITGRLPYGAQVARVRSRRDQQRLQYQSAALDTRAVPQWLDFALARACHRDPMRRYDAISEFIADLKSPSRSFRPLSARPLIERNPLRFWQGLSLIQALLLFALVIWCLKPG